jgi:ElaB/YqjD/DUF883 family membrane-anchored ribosome-binding protein
MDMADNDATPMTDADIETPPATTEFEAAAPLKDAGVDFAPDDGATGEAAGGTARATQTFKEGAAKISGQATDRLRAFAQDGQARAGGALEQLVQMLHDAANQVDDKLGGQYGDYARQAAGTVSGFADTVKNKDVDQLFDEARALVRKSPAVAVGSAAAVGFVLARLVQSGLEATRTADNDQA